MKLFTSGNEAACLGALAAGAEAMYGYPITPSTEILQTWALKSSENDELQFLQTEDETSAGFAVNGSVLAGMKTFTATAGPGTVLMQDPLSMAENLRLPSVTIVMQRGGPSTGTVNYSQQEVTLSCFGGNGEGLRIVYSAGNPQEMYDYVIKGFDSAWKYRFPTIILGDGYIGKQKTSVNINHPLHPIKTENLAKGKNLRNCFSSEDEFAKYLQDSIDDFESNSENISEYEIYGDNKADELIIVHGSTYYIAKEAVNKLKSRKKLLIFRPITLRPYPTHALNRVLKNKKKVYVFESAYGQFSRLTKDIIDFDKFKGKFLSHNNPAKSYLPEEIIDTVT